MFFSLSHSHCQSFKWTEIRRWVQAWGKLLIVLGFAGSHSWLPFSIFNFTRQDGDCKLITVDGVFRRQFMMQVDREALKPQTRVALDITTLTIMRYVLF
jgi:hypothetical protein